MKLAPFEVATSVGPVRRLGVVDDGNGVDGGDCLDVTTGVDPALYEFYR